MPGTVQILAHAGSTAPDAPAPELLRARVLESDGPVSTVELLESAEQLGGMTAGTILRCLRHPELRTPLLVTDAYLRERRHSYVTPCDACGFPEAFDPPSALAAAAFPDRVVTTATFTSPCPICDGTQLIRLLPPEPATPRDATVDELAAVLRRIVAQHFGTPEAELPLDRRIGELGGDDLDAMEIAFAIEAHFVVCLPDETIESLLSDSVSELVARLRTVLARHREGALLDLDD